MAAKLGSLVERAADALGATLDAAALGGIETWLARLGEWNARIDLTAARTPEQLVDLMLADALVLSRSVRLPPGARVVDVGAGAGAPGLALAIVRPDLRVTLAEPLGKRASFLRTVVGEIGRADLVIERARGEALARHSRWDAAVSRATYRPKPWLELGSRLVEPAGIVWVLLAGEAPPQLQGTAPEEDLTYVWPLTGAPRRAVGYRVCWPEPGDRASSSGG